MAAKKQFDWLDEDDDDLFPAASRKKPEGQADDYDPVEKFGWEMTDITFSDPDALNDWTGIMVPRGERKKKSDAE